MFKELFDFFVHNYFILVYFLTLVVAILYYRKYFDTKLKYFPLLIAYTIFNEFLGYFIRYTDGFAFFSEKKYLNSNDIIYNIWSIVFFGYFYFIYMILINKYRKLIIFFSIVSLLSLLINCFFTNPFIDTLYYGISLSSLLLFTCTILYILNLKPDLKWSIQKHNLMFWVTIGLCIFYLIFPIIYIIGFSNYELWQKFKLRMILKILIVLMYSLFSIGFIIGKRKAFR